MRALKDSGIEWIGQIPQAWSVGKTIFGLEMPITDGPHETPQLYSEGIPFVSAEAVSTGNGRINFENIRGYISQEYYEECCKKYIPQKEDIYMIKSGATTGKIAIVDTDDVFTIWSPLAVFRCNKERCISRYLFYTLQSDYYQKQVESKWSFGTQQNIGMRTLERLLICYPSLPEQERIAEYLDRKCAEIDALIAAKEKTNALLKERRQGIIYEAVTKGLNPDAPMKDSGIEWIGQIPEDWDVFPVKYLLDKNHPYPIGDGDHGMIKADDYLSEGIPYIRVLNLTWGDGLNLETLVYISEEMNNRIKNSELRPNDILIAKTGATIGKTAIVPESLPRSNTTSHVGKITISNDHNPKFFYYVMTSSVIQTQIQILSSMQSTRPELGIDGLRNLLTVVPPVEKQRDIATYLDYQCAELNSVIATNTSMIEKLKEYRQSIIYEAVTGKIEI